MNRPEFWSAGQVHFASTWCEGAPYLSEDGEALSVSASIIGNSYPDVQHCGGEILPAGDASPVWLAAYTSPRHEKAVARHLEVREIEHFLPVYRVVRRWKNGCNVPVEFPLFPSYVFVRMGQERSSRLLDIPGLLAFVGPGRFPAAIPDVEIDWLRRELPHRKFEPHPYLTVGSQVRITAGPLTGASGILLRKKNGLRVVLSVDLIRQSIAVEVGADEIEPF